MVDTERIRVMTDSDAISWIDEEEDRIFRHILALRAIRNSVAPAINRLPDEIISRIMILYKSLHLRIEGSFERSWEKITLVCRWWRSVAVKTAVLWTDIDFGHKSGAVAYLSRSRNAHLYVRVRIDGRSSPTHPAVKQSPVVWYKRGAKNACVTESAARPGLPVSFISDGLAGPV